MKTVEVHTSKHYPVLIGGGLLKSAGVLLGKSLKPCRICIVSDDRVAPLYAAPLHASLEEAGWQVCEFVFPHGETHKSLATIERLMAFLNQNGFTRTDLIAALGGGVVGDTAGFAAAVYLRGIRFVQFPTTLLAAVDSSVGGKTAVNLEAGKNLAGAFHQPELVLCDTDTFSTLPQEVYTDGLAEMIKYGLICDPELFEAFEHGDFDLEAAICRCVEIKARIVEADERDTGERQLLNFGHTPGHGIEKCSDFEISHGHAVGIGMAAMTRAAERLGLVGAGTADRVSGCLTKHGLPVRCGYHSAAVADAAKTDKKRSGNAITLVLPTAVGRCELRKLPSTYLPELFALGFGEQQAAPSEALLREVHG